jgi:hypothetical protein
MMAEPVTLYNDAGETLLCAAPSEVRRLLETGEWALEPPKPAPKPATRAKEAAK